MSENLIEYLAEECEVYVSDLSRLETSSIILPVVRNLIPACFSAEDWSDSLSYLFKESLCFESAETAKLYCINKLMQKLSSTEKK